MLKMKGLLFIIIIIVYLFILLLWLVKVPRNKILNPLIFTKKFFAFSLNLLLIFFFHFFPFFGGGGGNMYIHACTHASARTHTHARKFIYAQQIASKIEGVED